MTAQVINEAIKASRVLLIQDGEKPEAVTRQHAQDLAYSQGLDLVQVRIGDIPVVKIMDYKKMLFEQKKAAKELKKPQALKEIKLNLTIADHDYATKLSQATKFLKKDKVKVTVRLRGRERAKPEMAVELLNRFVDDLHEVGQLDKNIQKTPTQALAFLRPVC